MSPLFLTFIFLATPIFLASLGAVVFLNLPRFGRAPRGKSLERIKSSPAFKDGSFKNLTHTPALTEGTSFFAIMIEFFFYKKERIRPGTPLPSHPIDLTKLPPNEDGLVWFGHSSYFLQLGGMKFLVDPVFSGGISPFRIGSKSYPGTDPVRAEDMPEIDVLLISHDHWDHLDYDTVRKLKNKVRKVLCGLGVGEHLERWGYEKGRIIELDWHQEVNLASGFSVRSAPARHFSGRGVIRNRSLWLSFILKTPRRKLYLGGDSGYDSHFQTIGENHGPFDLALLECGQYDKSWRYIHMFPEETILAGRELGAEKVMPVHWGKFILSNNAWDDSIRRAVTAAEKAGLPLVTPLIGEWVSLDTAKKFPRWWEAVK